MTDNVFAKYESTAYPFAFAATLHVRDLAGGVPKDPNVQEGWLRGKIHDNDDLIRAQVAELMVEHSMTLEEATTAAADLRNLKGFRTDTSGLYIEGRQVKAAIKEAFSVAADKGKIKPRGFGLNNRKGVLSFVAEHIFVAEDRIYLGRERPDQVVQRFVHTWRGSAISYTEVVEDAKVSFTVRTDHDFPEQEWAMIWLTGGQQGVGADRSQGFGRYTVAQWDHIA